MSNVYLQYLKKLQQQLYENKLLKVFIFLCPSIIPILGDIRVNLYTIVNTEIQ